MYIFYMIALIRIVQDGCTVCIPIFFSIRKQTERCKKKPEYQSENKNEKKKECDLYDVQHTPEAR